MATKIKLIKQDTPDGPLYHLPAPIEIPGYTITGDTRCGADQGEAVTRSRSTWQKHGCIACLDSVSRSHPAAQRFCQHGIPAISGGTTGCAKCARLRYY
jgi:hypothetical protein